MAHKKQIKRRPSTKTITNVFNWMQEQNLQVYGPAADLEKGHLCPGNMDYTVKDMLRLAQLRKQYPKGIPEQLELEYSKDKIK